MIPLLPHFVTNAAPRFPAKIILYGEYVTLLGSDAIAVPLLHYSAGFTNTTDDPHAAAYSFGALEKLGEYLDRGKYAINGDGLRKLLNGGGWVQSNIPIGYGLGSSGAVVAAVYAACAQHHATELATLKPILANIEACFHGTSSGIDPLVSYTRRPLLFRADGSVTAADILPLQKYRFFLLDTQTPRSTETLVGSFKQRIATDPAYSTWLHSALKPATEACIAALLRHDEPALFHATRTLAQYQLEGLLPMIPPSVRGVFEGGISPDAAYTLKVCGAGGGGFFLGIVEAAAAEAVLAKLPFPTQLLDI